jgi:hypothetical protein
MTLAYNIRRCVKPPCWASVQTDTRVRLSRSVHREISVGCNYTPRPTAASSYVEHGNSSVHRWCNVCIIDPGVHDTGDIAGLGEHSKLLWCLFSLHQSSLYMRIR